MNLFTLWSVYTCKVCRSSLEVFQFQELAVQLLTENCMTFKDILPGLSRTRVIFPDFPGPGIFNNKNPGLSRRRGNPDLDCSQSKVFLVQRLRHQKLHAYTHWRRMWMCCWDQAGSMQRWGSTADQVDDWANSMQQVPGTLYNQRSGPEFDSRVVSVLHIHTYIVIITKVVWWCCGYSDETIIESKSKIEYFGHNRTQSKSWYQHGKVRFRSHAMRFSGAR